VPRTESRHVVTLVSGVLCKGDQTPDRSFSDATCLVLDFTVLGFKFTGKLSGPARGAAAACQCGGGSHPVTLDRHGDSDCHGRVP
jgi:hypothetical protein